MNPLHVAATLLATRRITSLVTEDAITEDIREAVTRRYPPEHHKLGYLVTCRKCTSVWAALAALSLVALSNVPVVRSVLYALALSEASIIADRYMPAEDFNL